MTRAAWLAAGFLAAATGCARTTPITSCDDPLRGVWQSAAGEPWMVLDRGGSLEVYPLFDDTRPASTAGDPELVVAPRVLDLQRGVGGLRGEITRRYMRGADACVARAPVRVTACTTDQLELVLADPAPPRAFAPCTWGPGSSSRLERWRRD